MPIFMRNVQKENTIIEHDLKPEDIRQGKEFVMGEQKMQGTLNPGFTILDYIESDGNQYINTEYNPSTNSQFELRFSEFHGVGCLYGAYHGDWAQGIGLLSNTLSEGQSFWYHHYGNYNSNIPATTSAEVLVNKNVLTINDKSFTATAKTSSYRYPLFLFGSNWNGTFTNGVPMRIHKFIVKELNVVLHHFIPVVNNSTGEVGMFDVVNSKFYGNCGSGEFITGYLD